MIINTPSTVYAWGFFIEGLLQNPQNGEVKALSVSVPVSTYSIVLGVIDL